jgi:ectoine hydroxylase-related dioxygenase (phytanoyl-CoA dioxygenase family)
VLDMRGHGGAILDLGEAARALCDRAVAETDALFRQGRRVQDAWRRSSAVRGLAVLPQIHERLSAAYGRPSFPFQTLNFREGSEQELHSDIIHFSSVPERFMCGVWIALEDITPGSGPLVYYPGSHRLPALTMRGAGVNGEPTVGDYDKVWAPRFAEQIARSGLPAKELLIPKGHAFVWAANLAHGGRPIVRPGSTRRSLVVHCYFDDSVYFTPMVSDVEGGRLAVRIPPDVRTGGWRWPRRDGRRVMPSVKTIVAAVLRDLRARPHIS